MYRETADVKFWGKFTRWYGWRLGRLAQCIDVFQRSPQFSYFRLKKNVKKWGDEDSGAVIRRKTFEHLSDIESDVNVRISELLEENWDLRTQYKELKKSLEFNNSELESLKKENNKFREEVASPSLKDSLNDTGDWGRRQHGTERQINQLDDLEHYTRKLTI